MHRRAGRTINPMPGLPEPLQATEQAKMQETSDLRFVLGFLYFYFIFTLRIKFMIHFFRNAYIAM